MTEKSELDWQAIKREHVEAALDEIDAKGIPKSRVSTKYVLQAREKHYPPKYVIGGPRCKNAKPACHPKSLRS